MAKKVEDITFGVENKVTLLDFLKIVTEYTEQYLRMPAGSLKYDAMPGRKYIRITQCQSGSRSAYCFLDYDGNIYMSSSWAAPAKYVRGTVFEENCSTGKGLGPYGATYRRRSK